MTLHYTPTARELDDAQFVITVNGTPGAPFARTEAEQIAVTYLHMYPRAIVKIIALDEYRVWAPGAGHRTDLDKD